jgi:hypothetical protein
MDRVPDFELRVWLSHAGYEAHVVVDGETIRKSCRDFRGNMDNRELALSWLRIESSMMLERLRKVVA